MKRGEMSLRFGILTISDRSARGEREDASGPALESVVKTQGWSVTRRETLPDELQVIEDRRQHDVEPYSIVLVQGRSIC